MKKKRNINYSFNKEWVKSVTKDQFLKDQEHLKGDIDLGAEYDKIVGVNKSAPKKD